MRFEDLAKMREAAEKADAAYEALFRWHLTREIRSELQNRDAYITGQLGATGTEITPESVQKAINRVERADSGGSDDAKR